MGIISQQGFRFKLVANGTQLDLFTDEEIFLSDNVTGLFDLGVLPADFTRQITVPGTKKNNAFFEHVYDISIDNPFLFATNQKVQCYLDFDGVYLSNGYLQLNRVNVIANKFIDSYEITLFGGLSSFARDINRAYLTDLTASLAQYNHTSSLQNITSSWTGGLFDGTIVYPMAEYGQKIQYSPEVINYGIDDPSGSLCVQDYKPAIRVKAVWDAIFDTYGYTYSGSFWQQPWLDNVYMLCNNQLRYPVYDSIDLETYGLFKIGPISGSNQTNVTLVNNTDTQLPWFNIQENAGENISSSLAYTLGFNSQLRGEIKLDFLVSGSASPAGSGMPQFDLVIKDLGATTVATIPLTSINNYLEDVYVYNATSTKTQKFSLTTQFNTPLINAGTYKFYIKYTVLGTNNFTVTLNSDNNVNSYLSITKVNQGGDGLILDVGQNMPYGTVGIKQIDFITSLQKKFNLVIYPNKTKPLEFIVETFNNWYNKGEIKNFNKYINLDKMIEVVPANNLAVNKLNFGDTLDTDYISQQFAKGANREFGKSYYVDTENFFSQGTFEVKTGFASSPLTYLSGTGLSGSAVAARAGFQAEAIVDTLNSDGAGARATIDVSAEQVVSAIATVYGPGGTSTTDPIVGLVYRQVQEGTQVVFYTEGSETGPSAGYAYTKEVDSGIVTLASGTGIPSATYTYTITANDLTSSVLNFKAYENSTYN
jgi:hypothetical protein